MVDFSFNSITHRKQEIISISRQSFDLFDDAVNVAFDKLKSDISDFRKKSSELNPKLSNYVEDNNGVPTTEDIEIFDEMMNLASDEYWSLEHQNALAEMKIIYLFKTVEITMKSLIHTAYPEVNTKDFFQWDSMTSYFKNIGIKISDFDGYLEVTQLRKVNNSIKHNSVINEDVSKISEFSGQSQYEYDNIESFYKRIKPKIQTFIAKLGDAIVEDLFSFDDERIEKISKDFKSKMGKVALEKLSSKLIE